MTQFKNTINKGDALRELVDKRVNKTRRAGVWNGAKESDSDIKAHDVRLSEKTAMRLFGVPIHGKVRFAWRLANIHESPLASLETFSGLDVDYLIHFRPDYDEVKAIIVDRDNIIPYVKKYGREIVRKNDCTVQIQLNTPSEKLPNYGSKKYNELAALGMIVTVSKFFTGVESVLEAVNEGGRKETTTVSSNPLNNRRKIGEERWN